MFTYSTVELLYGTSGAREDTGSGWGMQWGGLRKLSSAGGTFNLLPLPCVGVRKYVYTLHEQSVFLTAFLLVPLVFFFFQDSFEMDHFQVFMKFVTKLLLFCILIFQPQGMGES